MGEHVLTRPTTAAETRELRLSIERSIITQFTLVRGEIRQLGNGASVSSVPVTGDTATSFIACLPQSTPSLNDITPKPRSVPPPSAKISDLPKKPGVWRLAVEQWEDVDKDTGYSLRDWPKEWYSGKMTQTFGAKRNIRKLIADEFDR
jgi:hypothetical protein